MKPRSEKSAMLLKTNAYKAFVNLRSHGTDLIPTAARESCVALDTRSTETVQCEQDPEMISSWKPASTHRVPLGRCL